MINFKSTVLKIEFKEKKLWFGKYDIGKSEI